MVGMLWAAGPLVAVVAEAAVLAVASFLRAWRSPKGRHLYWFGLNLPIVVISASLAGLAWLGARDLGLHWSVATASYVMVYLAWNFVLVQQVNARVGAQSFSQQALSGLKTIGWVAATYLLVSVGVAVLARADLVALTPLFLIPVELLRRIVAEHKRMDDHAYETIVALTIMLQRAHPYTHGHLERVGRLAEEVGRKLGLPLSRARLLREAAVLHDIGKIAIDEEILDKPAKLTDEEYEHVKQHSEFGALILSHAERFQALVPWIRHHHERPDGRGYPHQLTDVEIPLESKVIAVSDAFDAMVGGATSSEKRNHREPMSLEAALAELDRCSGTQFDPDVVKAFREALNGGRT